jgi:serine/threonine protein kinase/tetratricopeptide (TPR) repeat protein
MWQKIKEIVGEALEREPAKRAAFLDSACAGDPGLRAEVESLLAAHGDAEGLSQHPLGIPNVEPVQASQTIGSYRLIKELGVGGMGQVWLAEQTEPVSRRVALKLIRAGMYDSSLVQRFQSERQSLAIMDHPAIAKVFGAGATPAGQPYFAMEFVDGLPITDYCDQKKLGIRDRLKLFIQVCEGVQHAHQKAIIHRDLKPSNILVINVDGKPRPRLIDFGLAKTVAPVPGETLFTNVGTFLGTPGYMSPEQADPNSQDLDTRTDVYSLGVVLYELLTGYLPFDTTRWKKQRLDEVLRQLRENDPQRPSIKISANRGTSAARAQSRATEPRQLVSSLRGDLDWITLKALERDRERRYGTPSELAADLERFLGGRPVMAGPDTVWYRGAKFVRRYWVGVTAVAAVLLALSIGAAVATWQARRAERRFGQVRHLANVFLFDFEQSIHNVPGTTQARQLLVKTALEYLESLSQDAGADPELTRELAAAYEKVGSIQGGSNVGNVGNSAGAVNSYKQAVALRTKLMNSDPQDAVNSLALVKVLQTLGPIQARTGDLDGGLKDSQLAVSTGEALLQARPNDHEVIEVLAQACLDLAFLEIRRTQVESAHQHVQRALNLLEPLAAAAPGERDVQAAMALAYWSAGSLFERTEEFAPSLLYFTKSVPLFEKLVSDKPEDRTTRRRLMIALTGLGHQQMQIQPLMPATIDSALTQMRTADDLALQEVRDDPANAEAVSDLVGTSTRLGAALAQIGKFEEANHVLRASVQAAANLVARDPASKENRLNLGQSHVWLAISLAAGRDIEGATGERQLAAKILDQLAGESPEDTKVRNSQVGNWVNMGKLSAEKHDWEGARRYYALALPVAEEMAARNPAFAESLKSLRSADQEAAQAIAKMR